MNGRVHYVLIGLFVLVFSLAFIAALLWFATGGIARTYDHYLVYLPESVAGLSRDSAVTYRGVDVGRVRDIRIDPRHPERVRVLLQVQTGTPVKTDTVAMLQAQGLTGIAYVNLLGGTAEAPRLTHTPGEPYPVIPSERSFIMGLDRNLSALMDRALIAVEGLTELLGDDNRQALARILAQLDEVTATLAGGSEAIAATLDDMARTLRHAEQAGARLGDLMTRFENAAASLEGMADELAATGSSVRGAVELTADEVQRFAGQALPEASAMVFELREAATNLRRLSEQLERDPGVLLFGPPPVPRGPGE